MKEERKIIQTKVDLIPCFFCGANEWWEKNNKLICAWCGAERKLRPW
jgi:uncharacterized membrane protein